MIKTTHTVELKKDQHLLLIPLGDVQLGAREYDAERFQRLIDWTREQERVGYAVRFLGMGDYVDPGSPSERHALRMAGLHDSTHLALNGAVRGLVDEFVEIMAPVRHNIIGLLTGHHNFHLPEGNADEVICDLLGCPWLGNGTTYVRLKLPYGQNLDIFAAHGNSSAQTAGGRVQARAKYADMAPGAHLVLVGHDVAKFAYPLSGMDFDKGQVKRYLVGTGAYVKSMIPDHNAGYAEKDGLRPADEGVAIINIHVEKRDDDWRVDYHVSV